MMKKRVLIVITKSNWGGAQRYVYDVATGLDTKHYDVHVALGGTGPLKDKLLAAGIPVTTIPHLQRDVSIMSEIRVFFFLLALIYRIRPRVLHINSSKIGGIGVVAGRLMLVPRIIFTAHGFAFNENRSRIVKMLTKFLYWIMIFGSSRTILVSEGMKRDVHGWPFIAPKIVVVHNAVGKLTFLPRAEAREALAAFSPPLRQWLATHPQTPLIGTIGELHHIKGHVYAYEALTRINDVGFVIIGGGDNAVLEQQQIDSFGLSDRVFLLGARDAAYRYLKAFDLFILPSLSETFGLVLLEAGLAGVPVVASGVGGIPDIITDGVTGTLVPPRDIDALAEAITHTFVESEHSAACAQRLKATVATQFNLQTMLKETERVYNG